MRATSCQPRKVRDHQSSLDGKHKKVICEGTPRDNAEITFLIFIYLRVVGLKLGGLRVNEIANKKEGKVLRQQMDVNTT